ncbi:MAG: hypothetical protein PHO42_00715 [Candidatus Omnitrophica bacterium]|nr:hypothetical protein [Candidatus Omnitrophota bacterium]
MSTQHEKKELLSRVITFLTREELDYIDKLSKDSLFTTGTKLPKAKIIEAMVEACMKKGVTGENIHSKEELMNKIFEEIARKAIFQGSKSRKKTEVIK